MLYEVITIHPVVIVCGVAQGGPADEHAAQGRTRAPEVVVYARH